MSRDVFSLPHGEMKERILAFDWSSTSLGPMNSWPSSLVNIVRMVLASRQPICFWWGSELLQFHNDDYLPMLSDRADRSLGAPFRELWADVWKDVEPFVVEALAGRGTWAENLPLMIARNGRPTSTFWTFSYSPLYDDNGQIAGLMNIVTETTSAMHDRAALTAQIEQSNAALAAKTNAERQQRLIQREIIHRMKNTLAMVKAIVSQSLLHATDLESGARAASDRITALGRAHDVLTEERWKSADVADLVKAVLTPHLSSPDRVQLDGPKVALNAQQALGLSLALHELSTNAVKYGALSVEAGRLSIRWSLASDGAFDLVWIEQNGPMVRDDMPKGFGSRLMTRVVPSYFDGKAELDLLPDGAVFSLSGRIKSTA